MIQGGLAYTPSAKLARIALAFLTSLALLALAPPSRATAGTDGVDRESGANRFETAADIALKNFSAGVDVVYVAFGRNFPDALAAGPAASLRNGPVLLVEQNSIPQATANALNQLDPDRIVIAGGPAVVSSNVEQALAAYVGSGPGNQAPACSNDAATVSAGGTLNDAVVCTDANGQPLTYSVVSNVTNGTLAFNPNGTFSYTPSAGFSGTASFTFKANDGTADSNVATFTITVTAPDNHAPVAGDDNGGAVSGGCWRLVRGVLANDTDPDGDVLTITDVGDGSHGTTELVSTPVGTFIRYINAEDGAFAAYTDSFTYTVSDGAATDTANVTVSVNGWTDTDSDGLNDACDPFALLGETSSHWALGVAEEFDGAAGEGWSAPATVFRGIMTNSVTPSLTQVTTAQHNGTGQLVVSASEGEAFMANNTQQNAFQLPLSTAGGLPDFSIRGRVCQPYPPGQFASVGVFFGTGDQENYIKAAVDTNASNVITVADTREVEGHGITVALRTAHRVDPSEVGECIELLINVRPSAGTYHPHYSLNDGACWWGFGGNTAARTVPTSWLDGTYPLGGIGGPRPLAVGIISSSQGPVANFDATFDFLRVQAMIPTTVCT